MQKVLSAVLRFSPLSQNFKKFDILLLCLHEEVGYGKENINCSVFPVDPPPNCHFLNPAEISKHIFFPYNKKYPVGVKHRLKVAGYRLKVTGSDYRPTNYRPEKCNEIVNFVLKKLAVRTFRLIVFEGKKI